MLRFIKDERITKNINWSGVTVATELIQIIVSKIKIILGHKNDSEKN